MLPIDYPETGRSRLPRRGAAARARSPGTRRGRRARARSSRSLRRAPSSARRPRSSSRTRRATSRARRWTFSFTASTSNEQWAPYGGWRTVATGRVDETGERIETVEGGLPVDLERRREGAMRAWRAAPLALVRRLRDQSPRDPARSSSNLPPGSSDRLPGRPLRNGARRRRAERVCFRGWSRPERGRPRSGHAARALVRSLLRPDGRALRALARELGRALVLGVSERARNASRPLPRARAARPRRS